MTRARRATALTALLLAAGAVTPTVATAAPVVDQQAVASAPTVSFAEPVWDEGRGTYRITATLQGQASKPYRVTVQNGAKAPLTMTVYTTGGGTVSLGQNVAPGDTLTISTGGQVIGSVAAPAAPRAEPDWNGEGEFRYQRDDSPTAITGVAGPNQITATWSWDPAKAVQDQWSGTTPPLPEDVDGFFIRVTDPYGTDAPQWIETDDLSGSHTFTALEAASQDTSDPNAPGMYSLQAYPRINGEPYPYWMYHTFYVIQVTETVEESTP